MTPEEKEKLRLKAKEQIEQDYNTKSVEDALRDENTALKEKLAKPKDKKDDQYVQKYEGNEAVWDRSKGNVTI